MINFNQWNTQTQTLKMEWFTRRDLWVNVTGLPLHLWNLENVVSLVKELGDGFVEIDKECIDFSRLDMLKIKIKAHSLRTTFEPMTVNNGTRDCTILVLPVVYQRDLRLDEREIVKTLEIRLRRGKNDLEVG